MSAFFATFCKKGHHVILATEWKSPKEYTIDANVHRVHVGLDAADDKKGRIAKIWLRYARLRSCIKKQKPDIVISFAIKPISEVLLLCLV